MKTMLLLYSLLLVASCAPKNTPQTTPTNNNSSPKTLNKDDELFLQNLPQDKYFYNLSKEEKQKVNNIFKKYLADNEGYIKHNMLAAMNAMMKVKYDKNSNRYNAPYKSMKSLQKSLNYFALFVPFSEMGLKYERLQKLKKQQKYTELQKLLPFAYDLTNFDPDNEEEENLLKEKIDLALNAQENIDKLTVLGYHEAAKKINLNMDEDEINNLDINDKYTVKKLLKKVGESMDVVGKHISGLK